MLETADSENWKSTPRRRQKPKFLSLRFYAPTGVFIVQTALLIFGWTFFGITRSRPVPLPAYLAVAAKGNVQPIIMVATLFASFLSAISGFFYTLSIRYALARFVSRPNDSVSLYTMTSGIKLAATSPIFNVRRIEWTLGAVICTLAVNAQTAGWATLLTPKPITLEAAMEGFELDLASPDFQNLMVDNQNVVTPDLLTNVMPLVEASGSTAISTRFSLPSILNFNQISYINSTNGIMPASYSQLQSQALTTWGSIVPANVIIEQLTNRPTGFPMSFSMTQQGFTSDISCKQQELDASSSPSMQILSASQPVFNSTITLAQMRVLCVNATSPSFTRPAITSSNLDAVFGISCPVTENGKQRWDFIITGSGKYKLINTTICSISPRLTKIIVDYNDATKFFNSSFPSFINGSRPWGATDAPWVGEFTLSMLLRSLVIGQSLTGNSVGDTVASFLAALPPSPDLLNNVLSEYVRGVLEFSVTLLRTVYSQSDNRLFPGNSSVIPQNMRIAVNGTFKTETIGWSQDTKTAPAVLLAPTLVSLLTITIIVVTLLRTSKSKEPQATHFFDPGNLLHVISASSAGGMNEPFPPFSENPKLYSEGVQIRLTSVDGTPDGRFGFVHVK